MSRNWPNWLKNCKTSYVRQRAWAHDPIWQRSWLWSPRQRAGRLGRSEESDALNSKGVGVLVLLKMWIRAFARPLEGRLFASGEDRE